jgi:hypothetical protein
LVDGGISFLSIKGRTVSSTLKMEETGYFESLYSSVILQENATKITRQNVNMIDSSEELHVLIFISLIDYSVVVGQRER